ncbi:MAG TPA: hypothetical protein VHO70_19875 [Chitinispirillaceae bacterium]|nr:hypothetical protein [Chitinispirillaceae bacterium]
MSISRKKIDSVQGSMLKDLFSAANLAGSLDISTKVRSALNAAIKKSPLSRHLIAGRMSELLDRDITKAMLDAWTADSKDGWKFPAEYIPAFCVAVEDVSILDLLCNECKCLCVKTEDQLRLELGHIAAQEIALRERKKQLQSKMKGTL